MGRVWSDTNTKSFRWCNAHWVWERKETPTVGFDTNPLLSKRKLKMTPERTLWPGAKNPSRETKNSPSEMENLGGENRMTKVYRRMFSEHFQQDLKTIFCRGISQNPEASLPALNKWQTCLEFFVWMDHRGETKVCNPRLAHSVYAQWVYLELSTVRKSKSKLKFAYLSFRISHSSSGLWPVDSFSEASESFG